MLEGELRGKGGIRKERGKEGGLSRNFHVNPGQQLPRKHTLRSDLL